MANRYWVGGTASWDGTAGTKWALTSGGAGGEPVPTSADDVFFDANSGANTVTIATGNTGAKTINCTGYIGTILGTAAITVSGNITLVAGMSWSHSGTVTINANCILTTAGKVFSPFIVSGAGITVSLGDALNASNRTIIVTQGTFDTANYTVTAAALNSTNTNTRAINLGSSTVTLSSANPVNFTDSTNLTFNAGTSSINCSGFTTGTFAGGGRTFYNVSVTNTDLGLITISGNNTFNNLSITAPASAGVRVLAITNDLLINGTLTCSGATAIRRIMLQSDTIGTTRTITAATFAPVDTDFRDITISGGASPATGTRLGDCGRNTNITFPAPKTVYWNPASSAAFYSASWATSSGSTTLSVNNVPLAQDTAVIDDSSRATINAAGTLMNVGTVDTSGRTTAITLTLFSTQWTLYKNFIVGSGVTFSGSATMAMCGSSPQTIDANGKVLTGALQILSPNNTVDLASALSVTGSIFLLQGTFDAKTYNVTTAALSSSNSNTRSLKLGSGTWTLTSTGSVWDLTTATNLTFEKGTANIVLSNTSTSARTFAGGDLTYNKLTIGGTTGTSTLTISGSNTFSELASTKTVAHTITFTAGTTTTVGAWTITGAAGKVVTLQSSTTSSYTLTKTGGGTVSVDYMSISRSTATPGSTWYAGANSTDGGNNSGWSFTVPGVTATGGFFSLFR